MPAVQTKKFPVGNFQPDIEDVLDWNTLTDADFAPASSEEKEHFIAQRESVSYWKDALRRLKKNTVAMISLGVLAFLALFAFLGPYFIPYTYDQTIKTSSNLYYYHFSLEDQPVVDKAVADARNAGQKTVSQLQVAGQLGIQARPFGYSTEELQRIAAGEKVFPHIFGTDTLGRDILVRVMIGTRLSMIIGVCAALIVLLIGATYGAVSGYAGGRVDVVMMRIVELIYSIPEILVVLLLVTTLKPVIDDYTMYHPSEALAKFIAMIGPSILSIFIAFGLLYWVSMSRIIRGQVLQLKQQEYITAARALGASGGRIIRRHLLPNCVGQIVVTTCLQIPSAIFLESFLSFLGLGVSAPLTSLGSMASDALGGIYTYTYRLLIPAVILSVMILAFNLFGDGLRDALDPRLKK